MNAPPLYRRHRFPSEDISHCVWLYFHFSISYRDVEEMMAMRGLTLTYETIRYWCLKFGQAYSNALHRSRPRPGDKWHLDEVFLKINGRVHYLWRALDQESGQEVLRTLLKGLRYVPRTIITDKLRSYSAAIADVMPSVEHIHEKHQNNRA